MHSAKETSQSERREDEFGDPGDLLTNLSIDQMILLLGLKPVR